MKIIRSFKYAFSGIRHGLEEHNMRFHVLATIVVIALGFTFSITKIEWIAILFSVGLVLSAELVNTAVEEVCDLLTASHPSSYKKAGKPKDISAGAVLIAAVVSLAIGLIIFIPYIASSLSS